MNAPRPTNRREFLRLTVAGAIGTAIAAACQTPAATPTTAPPTPTAIPKAAPAATVAPAPTAPQPTPTTAPQPTATTPPKPIAAPAASPTVAATPAGTTAAAYKANTAATGTIRWLNRDDAQAIQAARTFLDNTFAKQFPNVKVSIEAAGFGDWYTPLVAAMAGGTASDVFEIWGDAVSELVDKSYVTDVEPLVKSDYTADQLKDFYPWQWRDFSVPTAQGTKIRFGMPKYVNVMFTWYNKDLFDKAGVKYPDDTWDHTTYAEAAIKLTKSMSTGKWGLFYAPWSWDRYWYKVETWGGTIVDPSDSTKATFDSDKSLAAFEWSRKLLFDDKAMVPDSSFSGNVDLTLLFSMGRWAMGEDGFYPFDTAKKINKQFKWGYAHVPKGPTGQRKVLGTTDGFSMWKGSKAPDAAWELLKFLSGRDYQANEVQSTGTLPVRFSVLADWKSACIKAYPELADANLDVAPKAMEMGYPGGRQYFKKDSAASDIIVPALEKVFITGGAPVSYLKEVATQVTSAMRA